MKKYLAIISLFALPLFTFASVSVDSINTSKGSTTIAGTTSAPQTTRVSVDGTVTHETANASWSFLGNYRAGTHNVVANASDGSTATASFSISGGNTDPRNFPCAFGNGSCYQAEASGEITITPYGVNGCSFPGGCVRQNPHPAKKFVLLKYGEQGCSFFMGCKREL